ncbi:MAG: radical SAM protein [Deltaproteobacteria bacterium]|nr:radical SAM protein [Deltaproteobacteria bacterium]
MHWGNAKQKKMQVDFFKNQLEFLKHPCPVVPYLPDALDVDIANRCNIKCASCFHSIKKFKPFPDMTMATFNEILSQAEGRASTITFGNHGEALLHKEVLKMIERVKDAGFFLNIITNATLLTDQVMDCLIKHRVDRLALSVDTVDPAVYPKLRKGARLKKTLGNILKFLRLNYERGLPVYVNISTVNTEMALGSRTTVFEYFSDLPVHVIYTSDMLNFQGGLDIKNETKFIKRRYHELTSPDELPICINGFDRLLIRPNGNVSLCAIDWESIHVLGNVSEAPYHVLWNNERAQAFRRALIDKVYTPIEDTGKLCSVCDAKWVQDIARRRQQIAALIESSHIDTKEARDVEIGKNQYLDALLIKMKGLV